MEVTLRATLNQKEGRHIGSHKGFLSYAQHNRKKKDKKRGGRSCFEEAQDSYGLEAKHRQFVCSDRKRQSAKDLEEEKETVGFLTF